MKKKLKEGFFDYQNKEHIPFRNFEFVLEQNKINNVSKAISLEIEKIKMNNYSKQDIISSIIEHNARYKKLDKKYKEYLSHPIKKIKDIINGKDKFILGYSKENDLFSKDKGYSFRDKYFVYNIYQKALISALFKTGNIKEYIYEAENRYISKYLEKDLMGDNKYQLLFILSNKEENKKIRETIYLKNFKNLEVGFIYSDRHDYYSYSNLDMSEQMYIVNEATRKNQETMVINFDKIKQPDCYYFSGKNKKFNEFFSLI